MKKSFGQRLLCLLLAVLLTAALLPPTAVFSAEGRNTAPKDGTYRIRNVGTGLYLGVYNYSARSASSTRVFVSALNVNDTGEVYTVQDTGSGCYRLTPKNDKEKYSICCASGTAAGAPVTKTSASDSTVLFDITPVGDYYTIAPSVGDNLRAVLEVGDEKNAEDIYLRVGDYVRGDSRQLWVLEPISTTGITLAFRQTTVRLYSTGRFYAALQPSGEQADAVWNSSDDTVLLVGGDGSYCALSEGTAVVTAQQDGCTASMTVTVTDKQCFTWYSQNSVSGSQWDASLLTEQYWVADGVKKRFMWDGEAEPRYANWMDIGCAICSVAGVLHNMGAVMTTGYDFRSAQDGGLPADPYTVSLANTGKRNIRSAKDVQYGNPCYVAWRYIADSFTVDGEPMAFRKVYSPNRQTIRKLLEAHPQGIIAQMSRGSDTHYVILAECLNPEETSASKIEFRVYDPAAYYPSEGEGVPMAESVSYTSMAYRYYNIGAVVIYDTVSNIDK